MGYGVEMRYALKPCDRVLHNYVSISELSVLSFMLSSSSLFDIVDVCVTAVLFIIFCAAAVFQF